MKDSTTVQRRGRHGSRSSLPCVATSMATRTMCMSALATMGFAQEAVSSERALDDRRPVANDSDSGDGMCGERVSSCAAVARVRGPSRNGRLYQRDVGRRVGRRDPSHDLFLARIYFWRASAGSVARAHRPDVAWRLGLRCNLDGRHSKRPDVERSLRIRQDRPGRHVEQRACSAHKTSISSRRRTSAQDR